MLHEYDTLVPLLHDTWDPSKHAYFLPSIIVQDLEQASSSQFVPEHVVSVIIIFTHLAVLCFPHFSAVEWSRSTP
jgi:hypothetical protein